MDKKVQAFSVFMVCLRCQPHFFTSQSFACAVQLLLATATLAVDHPWCGLSWLLQLRTAAGYFWVLSSFLLLSFSKRASISLSRLKVLAARSLESLVSFSAAA